MDFEQWVEGVQDERGRLPPRADSPLVVNPLNLHTTTEDDYASLSDDDDSDMNKAFACLQFPDCDYMLKSISVVIGRNAMVQRMLDLAASPRATTTMDGGTVKISVGKRRRDSEVESSYSEPRSKKPSLTGEGHYSRDGGMLAGIGEASEEDEEEPFVGVHTPANEDGTIPNFSSISKKHLRIVHSEDEGWIMEVLGRNGVFLNGEYHKQGSVPVLEDWDVIAIAGLEFTFRLGAQDVEQEEPDEEEDEEEEDVLESTETSSAHKKISSLRRKKARRRIRANEDVEEEESDEADIPRPLNTLKLSWANALDKKKKKKKKNHGKPRAEPTPPAEDVPKKRGPGRPPKNGFMSQREMRERRKAEKMAANAAADPKSRLSTLSNGEELSKKLVGSVDGNLDANGVPKRRKYTKRLSNKIGSPDPVGETEQNVELQEELAAIPAPRKSPSPKREEFTEEQLRKPPKTYVDLLWEVLSATKEALALQQIYKAIKKRWPYYAFSETDGWQSSVRHNLIQTSLFQKAAKEGKGHLWEIVPGSHHEPKKRRASPPPQSRRPTQYGAPPTYPLSTSSYQPATLGYYGARPAGKVGTPLNGTKSNGTSPQVHNSYTSPYAFDGQANQPRGSQLPSQHRLQVSSQNQASVPGPGNTTGATSGNLTHPASQNPSTRTAPQHNTNIPSSTPNPRPSNQGSLIGRSAQPATSSIHSSATTQPQTRPTSSSQQNEQLPSILRAFRDRYLGMCKSDTERAAQARVLENATARIMHPHENHGPMTDPVRHMVPILANLIKEQAGLPRGGTRASQTPAPRPNGSAASSTAKSPGDTPG